MLFESREIIIHGNLKYRVDLGGSPQGNMTRIENIVKNLKNSKLEYDKPFPYEEYKTKLARQFELNQELDLGRSDEAVVDEDENGVVEELEFSEAVGV